MPYVNFKRVAMDQLYLPFLQPLLEAVAACNARGCHYEARAGYRSFAEQARLYFQGRTMPGKVVTDALPGYSAHNYGVACDFARVEGGKYSGAPADYTVLGEEVQSRGLVWGGAFHHLKDAAHVQLAGYVTGRELEPLKAVYEAHPEAPLSACWAFLDSKSPPLPSGGDSGGPAGGGPQQR